MEKLLAWSFRFLMLLTKNQRLAEVRWEKDNLEPLGNELTTRQKKNVIRHVERSGAKQIDALQKELGVTSNASISDAVDPWEDGGQPYEWPSDSNAADSSAQLSSSSNQVWSAPSQLPKSTPTDSSEQWTRADSTWNGHSHSEPWTTADSRWTTADSTWSAKS